MKKILIFIIKLYQSYLSPFMGKKCRFYPSCSSYTIEAIEKYGIVKGIIKGVLRISRCHPFNKGGYDPLK